MKAPAPPLFLAVGLHPAIDRTIELPEFRRVTVLRGRLLRVEAGGKTANVVHTLSHFERRVAATGFLGRGEADFFLRSFDPERVKAEFILVESPTRENVTLLERRSGRDIHILAGRLKVCRADVTALKAALKRLARKADWAVFSGSRPEGLTLADFSSLLKICRDGGGRLVVDASGSMLRSAVRAGPWLVKPNREELEDLAGCRLVDMDSLQSAGRSLLKKCENVLVSLGREGAVLITPNGSWRAREVRPPRSAMSVGCGDALLAGFISACAEGAASPEALRFGIACGSACARSDYACLTSRNQPKSFLARVRVAAL